MSAAARFSTAVNAVSEIAGALEDGLQALRSAERQLVTIKDTRRLAGSVDLDSALATAYPNQPRWDYAIGIHQSGSSDRVTWIEIHSANAHSVSDMLAKVCWLKSWLDGPGEPLRHLCEEGLDLVWLSTGKIAIRRGSKQHLRLSRSGLKFPVRRVELT